MVNSMLSYSGLSEGFWGESMLTAYYLLNRVLNKRNKTTPYELWYKKRPNLSFLRVWDCSAVVRLPVPKKKTLGEKGIDCIFVGYAEHSKSYRFYVIESNDSVSINLIIESRDAIFDENHFSSIPRPNDIIPNSDESQRDDHYDDVPSEIPKPRKKEAIHDEIGSIIGNDIWALSDLPPDYKPLGIDKSKAQLMLEGYSDASWINHVEDSSSTSRWVFLLGEVPFHGLSKSKYASLVQTWNLSL
nr:zinc finger, CCHC-type [Tanacetum cinerariifolium]